MVSVSRSLAASTNQTMLDTLRAGRLGRPLRLDHEELKGDVTPSRGSPDMAGGGLSLKLDQRTGNQRRFTTSGLRAGSPGQGGHDFRQRAVVKIHHFNHAGGGAGALAAHVRYVSREAAEPEPTAPEIEAKAAPGREPSAQTHAGNFERVETAGSPFYDSAATGLNGPAITEAWARADLRHFRVVLAPEQGARLGDLKSYTREVMARAEVSLGASLQWIAVNHGDTGHPHTHIIVRGRRANGQDLVMPRDFIKHGFRDIARNVASDWLGPRSRDDERRALVQEVRRHAPTRLDRWLEPQVGKDGVVTLAKLDGGAPERTQALKSRAIELKRLGLAREVKRGVFLMQVDWRQRLQSMELHLDIRKRVVRQRLASRRTAEPRSPTPRSPSR